MLGLYEVTMMKIVEHQKSLERVTTVGGQGRDLVGGQFNGMNHS